MKHRLNIHTLLSEATKFAGSESTHDEASLYGVTDGKAVGTYLEHKFKLLEEFAKSLSATVTPKISLLS